MLESLLVSLDTERATLLEDGIYRCVPYLQTVGFISSRMLNVTHIKLKKNPKTKTGLDHKVEFEGES